MLRAFRIIIAQRNVRKNVVILYKVVFENRVGLKVTNWNWIQLKFNFYVAESLPLPPSERGKFD